MMADEAGVPLCSVFCVNSDRSRLPVSASSQEDFWSIRWFITECWKSWKGVEMLVKADSPDSKRLESTKLSVYAVKPLYGGVFLAAVHVSQMGFLLSLMPLLRNVLPLFFFRTN